MVDDGKWSKKNEKLIDNLEYSIVDIALREGYNVVIDDTNGSQKRLDEMHDLFNFMEYSENLDVKVVFIDTPLEECIARDEIRENMVGRKVINDMYEKHFKKLYKTL